MQSKFSTNVMFFLSPMFYVVGRSKKPCAKGGIGVKKTKNKIALWLFTAVLMFSVLFCTTQFTARAEDNLPPPPDYSKSRVFSTYPVGTIDW